MGKINSKAKGSKNERDVCKWWKSWTGYDFSRVPSSGGLRWSRTADTTGDVICSDKKHYIRFSFSIEAKSYKDINFEHLLLDNKKIKILEFWEQALSDASRGGKVPILMMRYNGMKKGEYFFVIEPKMFGLFRTNSSTKQLSYIEISTDRVKLIIIKASEVLVNVSYTSLHKEVRKYLKNKTK